MPRRDNATGEMERRGIHHQGDKEFLFSLYDLAKDINVNTRRLRLEEPSGCSPRSVFIDEGEEGRSWVLWNCILMRGADVDEDQNRWKPEYAQERERDPVTPSIMSTCLRDLAQENRIWVVIIVHGGYFSGGVFIDGKVSVHKSCHRYVK